METDPEFPYRTTPQLPAPIFRLGAELAICRLGFGAMRLTGQPGNWGPYPDWSHGVRVLRRVLELGVNLIDTADAYGPGDSEKLICDALHPYPETLVIATKGGVVKTGPGQYHIDASPQQLKQACNVSLARLKLERIDLYQLHRIDENVPLAESIGALVELKSAGKIRLIGLSNVTLSQLQEAETLTPIASVQNRYNLRERRDDALIDYCLTRGIAYLPYGPLGAAPFAPEAALTGADDAPLARVAARLAITPGQAALAWLLHRAPNIAPIPGSTSLIHVEENVRALEVLLSEEDCRELASPIPEPGSS